MGNKKDPGRGKVVRRLALHRSCRNLAMALALIGTKESRFLAEFGATISLSVHFISRGPSHTSVETSGVRSKN